MRPTLKVVRRQAFSVPYRSACRSIVHHTTSVVLCDALLHAHRTRSGATSALASFKRCWSLLCCCCSFALAAAMCWLWAASLMAFLISAPSRLSALLRSCCSARRATLHQWGAQSVQTYHSSPFSTTPSRRTRHRVLLAFWAWTMQVTREGDTHVFSISAFFIWLILITAFSLSFLSAAFSSLAGPSG